MAAEVVYWLFEGAAQHCQFGIGTDEDAKSYSELLSEEVDVDAVTYVEVPSNAVNLRNCVLIRDAIERLLELRQEKSFRAYREALARYRRLHED